VEQLIVITHPEPVPLEAHPIEHDAAPAGSVAVAYSFAGHVIARGVLSPEAAEAIQSLLSTPVSVALAATEDSEGNIDGRVCLVLPIEGEDDGHDADPEPWGADDDEDDEPWKASVPPPPFEQEYEPEDEDRPQLALLPIGNVVRSRNDRHHPDDVAGDAREMLDNLLSGQARDAVAKAIDDLLNSI
jgi:hypothetical protein